MMRVFGKRKPGAVPARTEPKLPEPEAGLPPILIPRSAADSEDPADFVLALVNYVNAMQEHGHFQRDEISQNAMRSYHTDYYLAQVANGGHGQFVGNSGWVPVIIQDIRDGLAAMQLDGYSAIFSELCSLIDSDAQRAKAIADGGGFGEIDPAIQALDSRFYEPDCYKVITPANARWLRTLPELEIVEDEAYAARMQALFEANPKLAVRKATAERARFQHMITDPLQVAGRLLAMESRRMPFRLVSHGNIETAPDGREGTAWLIAVGDGQARMFLFDDAVILCDTYLPDGRLITPELHAQEQEKMMAGDFDGMAGWAESSNREVARVEAGLVNEAIEMAGRLPVVTAGNMLARKLGDDEEMVSVSPGMKHNSGTWLWVLETNKRAGLFGFQHDGVKMINFDASPLIHLDESEMRAAYAFEQDDSS